MDRVALPPSSARTFSRIASYLELGKFRIVELWLGIFVGISLLGLERIQTSRTISILTLVWLVGLTAIAATCSLDDVSGLRDGVDRANHAEGRRWGVQKPLLFGRLSERQALHFTLALGVVGAIAFAGLMVLAWPVPGWGLGGMLGAIALALNYSYGLKLSYLGAGELVIFVGGAGTVLFPFALVTGALDSAVLFNAMLVGAWHAQVVVFSNGKDAAGDRATGRMTIAARATPRGYRLYIALVFASFWGLTAAALLTGVVHPGYLFVLAPVWAMQLHQLRLGLREEAWLAARLMGFRVLRFGILALTLCNFLLPSRR